MYYEKQFSSRQNSKGGVDYEHQFTSHLGHTDGKGSTLSVKQLVQELELGVTGLLDDNLGAFRKEFERGIEHQNEVFLKRIEECNARLAEEIRREIAKGAYEEIKHKVCMKLLHISLTDNRL